MATRITSVTCTSLTAIDGTDCIGDTRPIINSNTTNLGTGLCTLSSQVTTLSNRVLTLSAGDTATIDLTYSATSNRIFGNVRDGSITGEKMSGGQTGSAPVYGCRAWVSFNGTSVNGLNECSVYGSGNVSKVVRNSTGNFTVYFVNNMPDNNYVAVANGSATGGINNHIWVGIYSSGNTTVLPTVSSFEVQTSNFNNGLINPTAVTVTVFR